MTGFNAGGDLGSLPALSSAVHLSSNWLTLTGRGVKELMFELILLLSTLSEDSLEFILCSSFCDSGGGGIFDMGAIEEEELFISLVCNSVTGEALP